jgi:hypothetical protein
MSRYEDRGLWLPERRIIDPRAVSFGMPPAGSSIVPHAAISFVKVQIANANTLGSIGSIQSGDIVIQLAFRNGSTTPPTRPGTWLTPNGTASNGADSMAVTIGYKYSTGTSLAGDTWTNATATIALVYRNAHATAPFSAEGFAYKTASTPPVVLDPKLMAIADGSSWIMGFMCTRATGINFNASTFGLTNRNGPTSAGNYSVQGYDTNAGVASFAGANSGAGITGSNPWQGYAAELLAAAL